MNGIYKFFSIFSWSIPAILTVWVSPYIHQYYHVVVDDNDDRDHDDHDDNDNDNDNDDGKND